MKISENMNLAKYLKSIALPSLTIPSNIVYGTAIYKRGAVEIITWDDGEVEAWAGGLSGSVKEGGGSRRRVRLRLVDDELQWRCTGNPKSHDIFCKHCVAVALFVRDIDILES